MLLWGVKKNMDLSEEKATIEEAKRNPDVFGLFYDKYYQPIFGYIMRRTANIETAQDLTSETFLKALKNLGKFKWQNVPFSAWLFRVATNEINSFYRRQKKFPKFNFEELSNIPSGSAADSEIITAEEELRKEKEFLRLHEGVAELNPDYQTVIALRFFEKKKILEISQILGKSEGTVKSQISRALEQLRKFFDE